MAPCGGFAQEACMDGFGVFPRSAEGSSELAGSYQMGYGTSYHAIINRGELKIVDEELILGASGGVGLAGLDMGKEKGARVVAGVSTEE